MIKAPPNNLRLIDGELVMADGSDVREYLRAWAERVGVTPDTPLSMVSRANLVKLAERATTQQPATAIACGIPGMAKTACPYCEQGFAFEYDQPATGEPVAHVGDRADMMASKPAEPVGVNQLRKELSDANDFIQSLADLCVKYETLLGYRKTKAPEGASELAEARGESNVNTELDLAMPDSICDHVFVLDPKSSIRICNKCGTVECKKHTHPAPSVPGDVVRDAERYRWLAGYCLSTSEHWGGRWSIIIDGPAPKTHDSEDDLDAAIDAAMLAAKVGGKQ